MQPSEIFNINHCHAPRHDLMKKRKKKTGRLQTKTAPTLPAHQTDQIGKEADPIEGNLGNDAPSIRLVDHFGTFVQAPKFSSVVGPMLINLEMIFLYTYFFNVKATRFFLYQTLFQRDFFDTTHTDRLLPWSPLLVSKTGCFENESMVFCSG